MTQSRQNSENSKLPIKIQDLYFHLKLRESIHPFRHQNLPYYRLVVEPSQLFAYRP